MSQPSVPKPQSAKQAYKQGIQTQLQFLPQQLSAEQGARTQYDPLRIAEQQALQNQFGPTQYAQQKSALEQIDPGWQGLRSQLGGNISRDLALGGQLTPEMETQLESQIRAAEAARGQTLGNAAATAEELMKGSAALNLYQQRLQNAGNYVAGPTPEEKLIAVQPVAPDRTSAYVNPNAGFQGQQMAANNYQNILAQYALSGAGRNAWAGALGGAASGAAAGSVAGPYGAVGGALIGGVSGYLSDKHAKEDIKDTGLAVKTFRYRGDPNKQKYMGVIAQELKKVMPHAVGNWGKWKVVAPRFAPVPIAG